MGRTAHCDATSSVPASATRQGSVTRSRRSMRVWGVVRVDGRSQGDKRISSRAAAQFAPARFGLISLRSRRLGGGGGSRNFASVSVTCSVGGTVVYATVPNVPLDAGGDGTSQRIYPPAGSCTADLLKQMQIWKSHVLGSTSFDVSP